METQSRRIDLHAATPNACVDMCLRQSREPNRGDLKPLFHDNEIDDPIGCMREPPGALGAIVRRMKWRASLQRAARMQSGDEARRNTA